MTKTISDFWMSRSRETWNGLLAEDQYVIVREVIAQLRVYEYVIGQLGNHSQVAVNKSISADDISSAIKEAMLAVMKP